MLAAVIDNGSTWLLDIKDNIDISNKDLENEWNLRYVGWIVNRDDISSIMNDMPISRYLLKDSNGKLIDINVKIAHDIYNELSKIRNSQSKVTKK